MFTPAARVTDLHDCPVHRKAGPILSPGHPTTLIAGLAAARVKDYAIKGREPHAITTGAWTVLIGGQAAARIGESCSHGGKIVEGCPTVFIGDNGAGGPQALTMSAARATAAPFVETNCAAKAVMQPLKDSPLFKAGDSKKKSWIEVSLVDEAGQPVPYEHYRVTAPDGDVREGFLDEQGMGRVDGIDPGTCKITFPNLDKTAWEPA